MAPFGRDEPGAVEGTSHLRQTAQWLREQFPDMVMTIESMVEEGDLVAVLIRSQGTNLGRLEGMIHDGASVHGTPEPLVRVEGARLAEHWATRDDLPAMIQLGVVEPPGPSGTSFG